MPNPMWTENTDQHLRLRLHNSQDCHKHELLKDDIIHLNVNKTKSD